MKTISSTPLNDGFFMPSEYSAHDGCIMIFPERKGSWPHNAEPAVKAFKEIISAIAKDETVCLIVSENTEKKAHEIFEVEENVRLFKIPQNDAWARDTAPTFVRNGDKVRGVNWKFNAWGGDFDGLYADYEDDDKLAKAFCSAIDCDMYDASPFVLEGGSIHSDGEGTVMTTESCLLSRGRNPELSKSEIEKKLCDYLGAKKVLWLPRGIYNDETNEHVDNVCAFVAPAKVVLAWTDNENDPQYPLSKACYDSLSGETDAMGRKIEIIKLPIPDYPVLVTEDDMEGYVFEEGEDTREIGERLAASYVNFYFSNNSVILPQFGGENSESDKRAVDIISKLCPDRKIVPIKARDIIVGGGNIHCITQQIPKGALR